MEVKVGRLDLSNVANVDVKKSASYLLKVMKADNDVLPGMDFFFQPLEAKLRSLLSSAAAKPAKNLYNPLLVNQLASDVTALLNRCLSNQREYFALEQSAVAYFLRYTGWQEQKAPLQDLDQAADLKEIVDDEIKHGTADEKAIFKVMGAALDKCQNVVQTLYKALEDQQDLLKKRHEQSGSALNFAERATTVWSFRVVGRLSPDASVWK
jgi:hypothetical protein